MASAFEANHTLFSRFLKPSTMYFASGPTPIRTSVPVFRRKRAGFIVAALCVIAELQHIGKYGVLFAGRFQAAENFQSGTHGIGAGVIGIIDQRDAVRFFNLLAHGGRCIGADGRDSFFLRNADFHSDRDGGKALRTLCSPAAGRTFLRVYRRAHR